ncbi:MAG: hypothetical protein HRF48_06945 [Chloroflexota bacterium]|jgi:hypothetical protein
MTALQFNLFTGEPEDRRTRKQRQADRQRALPQQLEMFSQRDIAQFGVKANPHIPLSGNVKLLLIPEDPRTPEEVERDLQHQAEERTRQMFTD